MKIFRITIALAAVAVAGGALARNQIDPGNMPKLRAGYWETTSTTQDRSGKETMTSFLCIDDAVQQEMSVFAQGGMGGMCSEVSMTPQGADRWAFRSVCNPANMGRMVSEGTISGDMRTRYRSETVTTGSMLGQSMNDRTVQEARHVGACPEGIVPGDIVTKEGKINMMEMGAIGKDAGGVLGSLGGLLGAGAQEGSAGQPRNGQSPAPSKGLPQEANELIQIWAGRWAGFSANDCTTSGRERASRRAHLQEHAIGARIRSVPARGIDSTSANASNWSERRANAESPDRAASRRARSRFPFPFSQHSRVSIASATRSKASGESGSSAMRRGIARSQVS